MTFPFSPRYISLHRLIQPPGRRVLRLYLAVFLHAHNSTKSPEDAPMNDLLERLAHTHTLGRYVAPRWNLERNMTWREMVGPVHWEQVLLLGRRKLTLLLCLATDWTRRQTNRIGEDFWSGCGSYPWRAVSTTRKFHAWYILLGRASN